MELKKLSDQDLLNNLTNLTNQERHLLAEILRHLREIDKRRLFLARGYSSMFSFCVDFLGYEESQAQRRISAARLITEIPEVETQVEEGKLSLTALTQAQSFFRQEALNNEKPLSLNEKKKVLKKLENKTTRQVEKELVGLNPTFTSKKSESTRPLSSTKSEIKLVINNETLENLNKLKDLLAQKNLKNKLPLTLASVIDVLVKEGLQKHDPLVKAERKAKASQKVKGADEANQMTRSPSAPHAGPSSNQDVLVDHLTSKSSEPTNVILERHRYIPAPLRRHVWLRDHGICTFTASETGRVCDSRHRLQLDHVIPWAQGGAHSADNLRLRCAAHNTWHAQQIFGEKKMRTYLEGGHNFRQKKSYT